MAKQAKSAPAANFRNRIVGFEYIPAAKLKPHPQNWRKHPDRQKSALRAVLEDVGLVDAVIARKKGRGYQLIDGHLRAELDPTATLPVLVVDLDDQETLKVLASHDPLAYLAESDPAALDAILASIEGETAELEQLLADAELLAAEQAAADAETAADKPAEPGAPDQTDQLPDKYEVLVVGRGEAPLAEDDQAELLEMLTANGWTCRALKS